MNIELKERYIVNNVKYFYLKVVLSETQVHYSQFFSFSRRWQNIPVFWDVMPCSLLDIYRSCGERSKFLHGVTSQKAIKIGPRCMTLAAALLSRSGLMIVEGALSSWVWHKYIVILRVGDSLSSVAARFVMADLRSATGNCQTCHLPLTIR
jgi:hypothetical protein